MLSEFKKVSAILERNFAMLFTYKFAFLTNLISKFFIFFWLILVGKIFGEVSSSLSLYNGNFVEFILIGSIVWSLLWNIIESMTFSVRNEMLMGTLEAIFLTPINRSTVIISYGIFGLIVSLLPITILYLIGVFVFNVRVFAFANLYTFTILILSCTFALGFGLMISGFIFWQKYIGDLVPLLQGFCVFFSEVYFPLEVLPPFLRFSSRFNPFYYCVKGVRLSLLDGLSSELLWYILVLFSLTVLFSVIGFLTLHMGITKAKREGTLSFY